MFGALQVGIDVGKGFVKVCDGRESWRYPSYYAITSGGSVARSERFDELAIEGVRYLCAAEHAGPPVGDIVQTRDQGKSSGPTVLLHVLNSLAAVYDRRFGATAGGGSSSPVSFSARVCVGLPISGYNAEKAELVERLKGVKTFERNGRPYRVAIDPHTCKEGMGAYLGLVLDERGQIRSRELYESLVAVVDIGHRTTDVFMAKQGQVNARGCRSTMTGIVEVQERIEQHVANEVGVLAPEDGIRLFDWLAGGPLKKIRRKTVNEERLFAARDQAVSEAFGLLVAQVLKAIDGAAAVDQILIAGGGAEIFRNHIRELDPSIAIVENPQYANVVGFQRSLGIVRG